MTDETPKRPYRMRRRAEAQDETRRRITESAVVLHGTMGPARTSISAVAAHAGVRRSTVYRHFPDEATLFDACAAQWEAANPAPDLASWADIAAPDARLAVALPELYAFYDRTEPMLTNLFRDELTVPLVEHRFAGFRAYLAAAGDTLTAGRELRGVAGRRTRAALGHAVAFSTWKSLVREQELSEHDAAALMRALVATAGSGNAAAG
ncbi:MAG TPA: TetR/AcrR family transcriptional regulator [Gaiellales bacterium]|jgi:AcrR family transcriptional regulator